MCDIFDQLHMRDIFIFGDHRLCTKSVPPPPKLFFLIVLRQLSECSHEGAVYGARGGGYSPTIPIRVYVPPNGVVILRLLI